MDQIIEKGKKEISYCVESKLQWDVINVNGD